MLEIFRQDSIKTIDRALAASHLLDEAIGRAGYAVSVLASDMVGGLYGKRIVVLYGPGNNGRDALCAAGHLAGRGAHVDEVAYRSERYFDPGTFERCDLVIDGCFGIGLSRSFEPPPVAGNVSVLAIDVPSGIAGDAGTIMGGVLRATATLCLTGLKLGVLLAGRETVGRLFVAGLDLEDRSCARSREQLVDDFDLLQIREMRADRDHKWNHSVAVFAGSPGLEGAARLVCESAYVTGAGIVHLFTGAGMGKGDYGVETVVRHGNYPGMSLEDTRELFDELARRFKSVVIGPGLGRGKGTEKLLEAAISTGLRVVIDADGISSVPSVEWLSERVADARASVVLTPHAGELSGLLERSGLNTGDAEGAVDRSSLARMLARMSGCTFLLKGGPTVIAGPDGHCYLTLAPDSSLGTAGSGDVLSGMLGAVLAYDGDVARLVALTAHLHGLAGRLLRRGRAGELAYKAREIFFRLDVLDEVRVERGFLRPTPIEGFLVGRSKLLEPDGKSIV